MERPDVAIIGPGPAGSALARESAGKMQVIALDEKYQHGIEDFNKPCDGLLTPDAQRSFIRDGLTLPADVIANSQTFSIKAVDVATSFTRNYQRSYININCHVFDLRTKSLISASVEVYHDSLCRKAWREDDKWHVIFHVGGWEQRITTRYLIGVDGASSMVRRHLYPDHQVRKYIATQQRFVEKHPVLFYSCIFDNTMTGCYLWNISKDGYFIFDGAYPMKDGQTRFTTLGEKISAFQFRSGRVVKNERYTVLSPPCWQDFVCGKNNTFLIDETAGFISTSSLEGTSYALDSAEILRSVLLKQPEKLNTIYGCAIRKLRLKLFGKVVKSRCPTTPALRKWIIHSEVTYTL